MSTNLPLQIPPAEPDASLVRTDPPCGCRDPFSETQDGREEILLDLRGLTMIGQIGRTLAASELLSSAQKLRLISEDLCWPLLAQLEGYGCRYRIVQKNAHGAQILIWRHVASRTVEAVRAAA